MRIWPRELLGMGSRFAIYDNHKITKRSKYVYLYLNDRANRDGICWPSISTIARDLEISRSTVKRSIKELRDKGLVTTKQRYRPNGGTSTLEYTLTKEN